MEKEKSKIIDGKDLANMKFIEDSEGRLIVHKPLGIFIPKVGEGYWLIDDLGDVNGTTWENDRHDKWRLKHFKILRTEEECKDYKWFLEMVDKYSYEFSNEEWKDKNVGKYYIYYDHNNDEIDSARWSSAQQVNGIYFKSSQDRDNFINVVGENRIKKYMFGIWS